jgi:hypothetical protein
VHWAEGHGDGALDEAAPAGSAAPSASSSAAPGGSAAAAAPLASATPAPTFTSDPPDPTPLRQVEQYEYTIRYDNEKLELVSVRAVRFEKPVVTSRKMGRYAVELWIGHELVDRVRFDFPLLAASEPGTGKRHKLYDNPSLTGGSYTVTVLVPAAARARSARLVDRGARRQAELSWPPTPSGLGAQTPLDGPPVSADSR